MSDTENSRDDLVRQRLANTEIFLSSTDIPVEPKNAFRIPFDKLTDLGVGFASMPTMFRSFNLATDMPSLLTVTDKAGKAIDPAKLYRFNDGTGIMGSFPDQVTKFGQARFHTVTGPDAIKTTSTLPYDPTNMFMAAALMQITAKLDSIEKTVDEMFLFMQEKEKAHVRGNLIALQGYLNEYRYNCDNPVWMANAHKETLEIKRESEQAVVHLRSQIKYKLDEKGLVEVRAMVDGRLGPVLSLLKEYQVTLYTYAFASFLEPMLSENFDEHYLATIADNISSHGYDYQVLYTDVYNAIEASAEGSADTVMLDGIASALSGLGSLIKNTPVGDATLIDEAFEEAGKGLSGFNKGQNEALMEKLLQAKTPDVLPFRQAVESVNQLHNKSYRILADGEAVYLEPLEEEE